MDNTERAKIINEKLGRQEVTSQMLDDYDNGESMTFGFDVLFEVALTSKSIYE